MTASRSLSRTQWALQGIIAAVLLASAAANLSGAMVEQITRLGYPAYLCQILGAAYLIAIICLYQPRYRFLQEWAFAGVAVSFVGAAGSHLFAGDPITRAIPAIGLLLILIAAYALRRHIESHTLPLATIP
ncbi:MAG: DoxX family protein [Pseudomonadota bacterium]